MSSHLRRRSLLLLVAAATFVTVGVGLGRFLATEPQTNTPDRRRTQPALPHTLQSTDRATPLRFARHVVTELHSYDTRFARDEWRSRLLSTLGAAEGSLAALDADRLIPDTAQWAQMAAVGQRASTAVDSAYVPAIWRDTVAEHPQLPDGAVAVTVTGTQSVSWDGGSSRVPVAVTLLLLCPPATERCVVSRITAQVAR